MHGPWHPILHNSPRTRKDRGTHSTGPQYVPVIANDYSWYRPLDRSRKEIRILFLEPEPLDSPKDVVVHVFNASLLDPGVPKLYGCVSYCWGDATITKAIQVMYTEKSASGVNGLVTTQIEFQVTANLEAALRVFRSKLTRPVMWADALCIDQSDTDERSSQVSLMAEIYTQAVQTIVWLGKSDGTTKMVFDFANLIADMADKAHEIDPATTGAGINCTRLRPLAKGEAQFTEQEVLSDEFYMMRWGVQALIARPFFRRAWVLQEVGLTDRENVVVHCGEHSLLWQIFLNLTSFEWRAAAYQGPLPIEPERDRRLKLPSDNPSIVPRTHHTLPEIWAHLRRYCSSTQRANIIDLIFRRLEIQATDPRDQVFALFSLAEECRHQPNLHPGFRADYSRTMSEAFTLFTRAVIEKLQNLVVLSAVDGFHQSEARKERGLPSWVPDYSNHINLRRTLGYLGYACYTASGKSKPTISYATPGLLSLSAFVVDTASLEPEWGPHKMEVATENVNSIAKPAILSVEGKSNGIRFLWQTLYKRYQTDVMSKEGLLDAFILTLVCARRDVFDRVPAIITSVTDIPELFADFAAYWKLGREDFSELPSQTEYFDSHAELLQLAAKGHAERFGQRLFYPCHQRSFVMTERGFPALVPLGTKAGDSIVICEGANVPFVLRKVDTEESVSERHMEFIGECYVHGMMTGKAMDELDRGKFMREMIHLI
ncbi:Nn.00g115640.m01.CDS01 [Neocucurbitaria sp. VM-36]